MLRLVTSYAVILAALILGLKLIEHRYMSAHLPIELYITIIALAFTSLGVWVGLKLTSRGKLLMNGGFEVRNVEELGESLSQREQDILREMALGKSNNEISQTLHISENTVKTHVSNVLSKLGAKRRTEALYNAQKMGLITHSKEVIHSKV